ncbi:hypothetical protein F4776DRAFT_663068 [Hypoxylon sp. NC0597]|nr:hypothetical protein F4776DRAFT_663068 [Hypoxylon sp. NC0597]
MLSSIKSIAILAFVASATAGLIQRDTSDGTFHLPADSPNGAYELSVGESSEATYKHLGDDSKDLVARKDYQGQIHCKNQYTLNYDDMGYAEQGFENNFGNGNSFYGKTVSYKYGSAVAYGCNYGHGQTVTGTWLAAQFAAIAQSCGAQSAGWVSYPDWKASYGIDNAGVGFC